MNKRNDPPGVASPKITMPSGGGALHGISEPFKTQSFTGAGSCSIPFPLPDARGFSPAVTLTYSSGAGNGLFGLGFTLALDSVVRKTSNGIPRYDDTDVFLLGGEDLLPKYDETGTGWVRSQYSYIADGTTWSIVGYRPRIEGAFALIEQWTDTATQTSHWKVITADNVTSLYGVSDNGRVYNPQHPGQIFEWLIESSCDAHGNKILYRYKAGDTVNIPDTIYNAGRDVTSRRYPDTIQYGNYFVPANDTTQELFAFEVVFDYGQLNRDDPDAAPASWVARPDPFSTYKSGFEIRTTRLCYGIYLRHHFTEENNGVAFTTAALLPEYDTTSYSGISIIKSVLQRGYRMQTDQPLWIADTPATELTYQDFDPLASTWEILEADAPGYFNSGGFMPVDLDGIGIDGLLYSNDTFTGYLAPLGQGRYAPMRVLSHFPVFRTLQSGQVSLASLDGNNVLDLVINDGVSNGFFEHTEHTDWKPFQPFARFPVEYLSPEKEMTDLSGTGRSDLLFPEDSQLKFYASEGKTGFAEASYAVKPPFFPVTANSGSAELTGFSGFLGDGLQHRFCLRNGSLTVWPCLGHGQFGAPVMLGSAPVIDGLLDASCVFLIDADGNGATDIVYCFPGYARIWFNRNGNTFSDPVDIVFPATYSNITAVTAGDVTGYGTTSLIFTVTDPEVKHLYYDCSNQHKPYLLYTIDNGVGGLSSFTYTTSVLEQLRDRQEGRIWPTRLPIAVSVIQESTTTDRLTGAVYTNRYRYHDGYFDTTERTFRGFGFVETWDCETYEQFLADAVPDPKMANLLNKNLWMPPVYTRSWFITGAYEQTPAICAQYETEFYKGDTQQWSIPFFELDAAWEQQDAPARKQAYASLAGQNIRTEVYADDRSPLAGNPYTVSMSSVLVRLVQPRLGERYCSVMPIEVDILDYTYDRNPADPLISQRLVLSLDVYGHPLLSADASFPRRTLPDAVIYPEQQQMRITLNEAAYINTINTDSNPEASWQYLGINWQNRGYETGNVTPPADAPFTRADLLQQLQQALSFSLGPVDMPPEKPWSRLLSWDRSVYWNSSTKEPFPYGETDALNLLHHEETAALNPAEITRSFGDKVTDDMLAEQCGYVLSDGYWWNYGMMQTYNWSREQFYQPSSVRATITDTLSATVLDANGFNGSTAIRYDTYYLSVTETIFLLSEDVSIPQRYAYDYQCMLPVRSIDANRNVSEILYDPLGQVIVTSVYGMTGSTPAGDLPLREYIIQPNATFNEVISDPGKYLQSATTFFYYDLFAWKIRQQPVNAVSITRMLHIRELAAAGMGPDDVQMPVSIAYSNGLGTILQTKVQTTPGEVTLRSAYGTVINPAPDATAQERWLVSGRTVYNNKGMPVEQYQPYFSATPDFEDQQEIIDQELVPPPSVLHYDPAGRVIRTDTPKGFFSKTIYTSWETISYDLNDTLPDSPYYQWFIANYPATPATWQTEELAALQAALPCYNTPATTVTDNLGNIIRTIACNLGAITAATIPADVASPMLPADAWNALLAAGYIAQQNTDDVNAWVTRTFQPYRDGFHQIFLDQFPDNGERLEDYLAQSCMTSLGVYDIQGQQLYNTDPRLFLKMVREETFLFNVRNEYGMDGQVMQSESADAGTRWSLSNMAGNPVYSCDSRGFEAENQYDNLQRPLGTYVTGGDQETPMANWVQRTVYGETAPHAENNNLIGKTWKDYDEAGLSVTDTYSIAGAPMQQKTYLRPDYKTPPDWTTTAQEDMERVPGYTQSTLYNVAGQIIAETLPDGSELKYTYNINGALVTSRQKIFNQAAATELQWQTVISEIIYDAAGKRTRVTNGNGVITAYTYDALTQQIVQAYTTRSAGGTPARETVLQDLYYVYDPMGHLVHTIAANQSYTFHNNQAIEPGSTYAYDPLYRIIRAQGYTMPGLNVQERNGAIFPGAGHISDLQNLENYTQYFSYDFGDNLVQKRHVATSGNRTQVMTIAAGNNHLDTMYLGNPSNKPAGLSPFRYDANGNMLMLSPGSTAQVNWSYRNHISGVTTITREIVNEQKDGTYAMNDAEYYQYNTSGKRVRKVTERIINNGRQVEYTEKIYLGSFQQSHTWTMPIGAANNDPWMLQSKKHTIILNDGDAPALITHVWVIAPPLQNRIADGDMQYRYQLCDPLDSVTIEVNEAAEILTFEQYYVYGGTSYLLAGSQVDATWKELRFCGKERDALTGLYYYGARYYVEWLCRWMSPDPAGPVDGPNLYEYVGSNPVNYNDPTGLMMGRRSLAKLGQAAPTPMPSGPVPSAPTPSTPATISPVVPANPAPVPIQNVIPSIASNFAPKPNLKPTLTITKTKPALPYNVRDKTARIKKRNFSKPLKKAIGGTVSGEDISHKLSAEAIQIMTVRVIKDPAKIKPEFLDHMEQEVDFSGFSKKETAEYKKGIQTMKTAKANAVFTENEADATTRTMQLYANRNTKNLRNRPSSENKSIGPYPHPEIENGYITDDGDKIFSAFNDQAKEFDDADFSDAEDVRIFHGYGQIKSHVGTLLKATSDMTKYRIKSSNYIQ